MSLARVPAQWLFTSRRVAGWEQIIMPDRDRGQRQIQRELRLQPMTDIGTGSAHGKGHDGREEFPLLGGCRIDPVAPDSTAGWPLTLSLILSQSFARLAVTVPGWRFGAAGYHRRQPCQRLGAALLGMLARFDHQGTRPSSQARRHRYHRAPDRRIVVFSN